MRDVWTRFEAWLSEHWPEGLASLNPPATDEQITGLQQALGVTLPDDYVACLKIHNGQASNAGGGMFDGYEFLSTDEILAQWAVWKELLDGGDFAGCNSDPSNGIRDDWWNARWIPITHNGCGDHFCLDFDPDASGSEGQVITMWHDSGERELLSRSFGAWFESYTKRVFSGDVVYSEEYGSLINREDAELS
jgi:cell wall assembly regulator SMI1